MFSLESKSIWSFVFDHISSFLSVAGKPATTGPTDWKKPRIKNAEAVKT
jgi:hypothetical protein